MLLIVGTNFQAKSQENFVSSSISTGLSTDSVENHDSIKGTITNVGNAINTPLDEFAPVISADGLMMIFTSRRPIIEGDIEKNNQGMENVYVSYFDEKDKKWMEAKMMEKTINQTARNNSAIALSNDGQRMLLYRGDPDGNIYESVLKGVDWSEPVILPAPINSNKQESSASISPDGRTIYFVSDRKGGQGGSDIWLCRQDNTGKWEKAENLGIVINTPQDEEGVFIHPDGKTIYFSSKGHNTIGGFDVFKSVFENDKWSMPVNLGPPINTPNNDLFFTLKADGKTGYYSSAHEGGIGKEDIYEIKFRVDTTPQLTMIKGNVTDESNNPVGSKIQISDNKTGTLISMQESNSATGNFLVSLPSGKIYKMQISAEGYDMHTEDFNIPKGAKFKELNVDIQLKRKEQTVDIEVPVTDEKGNALKAKIEIVNNATGEVIVRTTTDKVGKYLSKLKGGKNYGMTVSADGYLFQSVNLDIPPGKDKLKLPPIILKKIQVGKNIVLNNIFFDFNKASLRPDSKPELQHMATVLKENPTMKIELSGHTDNKGSAAYNLKLSEARAKSVVDFLSSTGIERTRLSFKGYGFSKPIASNETEEGRQQNRRTEFKVLAIDENAVSVSSSESNTPHVSSSMSSRAESRVENIVSSSVVENNNQQPRTSVTILPEEFAPADKNNDGKISLDELVGVIDGFFDGTSDYTIKKINSLIDYFFEQ